MSTFNAEIKIPVSSEEELKTALTSADKGEIAPLRGLCRKEVDRFESYLKRSDPEFHEGLVRIERMAIEGYLYQMLRGHVSDTSPTSLPPGAG